MKILVCTQPGRFEYREVPKPQLKKDHALLRVDRIGICGTDLHAFEGTQPYFSYPRILGHELSAVVEDIDGSSNFAIGESVTIIPYFSCGKCIACRRGKPNCCEAINVFGVHIDGGMQEYISVPVSALISNRNLSADALALIEPFSIGRHGIERVGMASGSFALVIGAGPIGIGIMEMARIANLEVIAMDTQQQRLDFCKEKMQIAHCINAGTENVTEKLQLITNNDMPLIVLDATGNRTAIQQGFNYMAHGGYYILVGLQKETITFSHPEFHKKESTLMSSRNATRNDFDFVMKSFEKGLLRPDKYITHRIHFDEVAEKFETLLDPAAGVIKAMVHF